jgi:hypothetical protein
MPACVTEEVRAIFVNIETIRNSKPRDQSTAFYEFIHVRVGNGILQENRHMVNYFFGNAGGHANVHVNDRKRAV